MKCPMYWSQLSSQSTRRCSDRRVKVVDSLSNCNKGLSGSDKLQCGPVLGLRNDHEGRVQLTYAKQSHSSRTQALKTFLRSMQARRHVVA